ncbi:MAG: prepilin peptidase [Planctomycetaceae bacterium]|nr:prepilin peptidase [Planctomycetaceae bacterium]
MTLTTWAMLLLTAVAAVTDFRRQKIYNWTTYPGIVLGLGLQGGTAGWTGLEDGVWGFLACGGIMLACFVFFPDLGGGDVKLIAMLGAGLGLNDGILAMLWTFVIGFCAGLAFLIWSVGARTLLLRTVSTLREVLVLRRVSPAAPGSPMRRWLYLAPAALAAVLIVRWQWLLPQ